ncbi:transcriptional regulator [Actinoplanes sp. ATCC 53533]|uniref:LacI family DNA-binding transcriptional regulator n=1 Tax=Actinoplanes sp. ATCC 53533 TaxID=1288362 RepID=UPI000F794B77|nr:LacI family DNA-binding transcriptional regulator [Actinoplanes sp. ATCC 53533]RSM51504.1 transcriptional regulator [Actinoplanes sp. ATCC 53533]
MSESSGATPASRPARPARASSTDVARLAGVSQKTVSRVMNEEPHVKDDVRRRVLQAAAELGYRRNNAARTLLSGRSRRIGVVALGSALYGPSSLLVALERAAHSTGYALSLANTFEDDPAEVLSAVDALLEQGVDGVVISEPIDMGDVSFAVDVPVLSLGHFPGLRAPRLITVGEEEDNAAAGAVATEHLLSLGHRTVRHVAGPQRWWSARGRVDGWRRALKVAGAEERPYLEGDWTPESGYRAGQELARDRDLTAVFVGNDDMAIGVIRALHEAGLSTPGDVSVVGFDDIPSAAYLVPSLTTVAQEFDTMARNGLTRLVRVIENPADEGPGDDTSTPRLVIRSSTAAPSR